MARADYWNQYGNADLNHVVDSINVNEGSQSLNVDPPSGDSFEILDASEADAPTEARVITDAYINEVGAPAFFFRYQDANNFYAVVPEGYEGSSPGDHAVYKVVGGSKTLIGYNSGIGTKGSWNRWRISNWVSSTGNLRTRFELPDGSGGWTQDTIDVIDTSPDLTSGGGVGVGYYAGTAGDGFVSDLHYDATEVYY